jgi:formate dehydrogenase maturation protein FdhE
VGLDVYSEGGLMLRNDEYVQNGGNLCPYCHGEGITSSSAEFDGRDCWRPAKCDSCGAEWNDLYELVSYELVSYEAKA